MLRTEFKEELDGPATSAAITSHGKEMSIKFIADVKLIFQRLFIGIIMRFAHPPFEVCFGLGVVVCSFDDWRSIQENVMSKVKELLAPVDAVIPAPVKDYITATGVANCSFSVLFFVCRC